jgi:hypothetical protein
MTVYRVMLKAEGLRVTLDGSETPCGFYKTEFVWARRPAQAIHRARANVAVALRRNPAVNQADLAGLALGVDEIEAGQGLGNLVRRQGFAFYRLAARPLGG